MEERVSTWHSFYALNTLFFSSQEFSLRKRIQTKESHQALLHELKEKSVVPEEQAAWLLKEHAQNVGNLERIHDDELCRQKLVLEEKLAKRRALAELSVSGACVTLVSSLCNTNVWIV